MISPFLFRRISRFGCGVTAVMFVWGDFHDYGTILYHRGNHHLSDPYDLCGLLLQPAGQRLIIARVLSGRPEAGTHRYGHERRSVGYEQLAAHGPAGAGVSQRHRGTRVDRHRIGGRHLSQLADRGQTAALLLGPHWGHHHSRLFLPPLPGRPPCALVHCGGGHSDFLHPLYGLRL